MKRFWLVGLDRYTLKTRRLVEGIELDNGQAVTVDNGAAIVHPTVMAFVAFYKVHDRPDEFKIEYEEPPDPPTMHSLEECFEWLESINKQWSLSLQRVCHPTDGFEGWRLVMVNIITGVELPSIQKEGKLAAINMARAKYEEQLK